MTAKKITVKGTTANPPVGMIIGGSKAAMETSTKSIVNVLEAVKACDMDDEVAISAMDVLVAIAKNPVSVTVRDCEFNVVTADK